jgi:hypothetical protein
MIKPVSWEPPPDVLRAIPISTVHDYLTRRGWVQMPSSLPAFRYYEHSRLRTDDGRPVRYYFPASDHWADYPLRVLDFIEAQAQLRDVHPNVVFRELTGEAAPPADDPPHSAAG